MRIKSVRVENYCAIRDETLECGSFTALVGANGSGKSSFLRALDLFFNSSKGLTIEDIYNRAPDTEIRITVMFDGLSNEAKGELGRYVVKETLTVTKVISFGGGKPTEAYYGHLPVNEEFDNIRRAPSAGEVAKQYAALRTATKYQTLPHETTKKAILPALLEWEMAHPEVCKMGEDDGTFFGIRTGSFEIGKHVKYVLVPAIRDASDDVDGNGTAPALLDGLAQESLMQAQPTMDALEAAKKSIIATIRPAENADLRKIGEDIEMTLQQMAPTADISVTWSDPDLELILPQPTIEVGEDRYRTRAQRAGHGVQRALIIAILQHHAAHESRRSSENGTPVKHLILGIEEPELFQHPNRQRHLADILHKLAEGRGHGVVEKTQVLLATHSPLFVNLDYFDSVRRVQKLTSPDGGPPITRIVKAELGTLATALAKLEGYSEEYFTPETLRARLRAVMTPWMNEGFFARKIILVEGEGDRAAILAAARCQGKSLEAEGISVIPALGKGRLDRPYLVFSSLKIPTYMMWDADREADPPEDASDKQKSKWRENREKSVIENKRLLRVVGAKEEEFPEGVFSTFAVHRVKLEETLREDLGTELYEKALRDAADKYGYKTLSDVEKSPEAMEHALSLAIAAGGIPRFLLNVLEAAMKI